VLVAASRQRLVVSECWRGVEVRFEKRICVWLQVRRHLHGLSLLRIRRVLRALHSKEANRLAAGSCAAMDALCRLMKRPCSAGAE
jgi:hypothetical protein